MTIMESPPSGLLALARYAWAAEQHSTCLRRHVGCALGFEDGRVIATGFNGIHSAMRRGAECSHTAIGTCGCLHAEVRAAIKVPSTFTVAAITAAPCSQCAKVLIDATRGTLQQVIFWEESIPGLEGIDVLHNTGVRVAKIPASVVKNYS